jgi:hypothetical protein
LGIRRKAAYMKRPGQAGNSLKSQDKLFSVKFRRFHSKFMKLLCPYCNIETDRLSLCPYCNRLLCPDCMPPSDHECRS